MSSNFDIYVKEKPSPQLVMLYCSAFPNLKTEIVESHKGTNITLTDQSRDGLFVCSIDGPYELFESDIPDIDPLAELKPKWLISLQGDRLDQHIWELIEGVARFLANKCGGVVIDCQKNIAIWPKSTLKKSKKVIRKSRVRIVDLTWFFSETSDIKYISDLMLTVCAIHCPEALPTRYGDYEPLQNRFEFDKRSDFVDAIKEGCVGTSGIGTLFWEAKYPIWGGSIAYTSPNIKIEGGIKCFKLKFTCDCRPIDNDISWSKTIQKLFTEMAIATKPFFASGYVIRNVLAGKRLWFDGTTEKSPFPKTSVWLGLPSEPTWMTWYGKPYIAYIQEHIQQNITAIYDEGIFISHGDTPRDIDELRLVAPNVPPNLVVRHELPPTDLGDVYKYMAAGFRDISFSSGDYVVNPRPIRAEFIPELR